MASCDIQHYLLCVDSSESAKKAMKRGLCIARPADTLTVFCAYPAGQKEEAEKIQADAKNSLLRTGNICTLKFSMVEATEPKETIIEYARENGVTTIVMGRSGSGAASMMGSVSSHVVACSPCSVLVVK